ncbi:CapA family protein [Psychroserpens sp. MEBiC05023]
MSNMLNISFLGDISFNNGYNDLYENKINPFEDVELELSNSNFNIGNLECMAKGNYGENALKHPRLGTHANTLELLKYLNLGVVTLAHNHVFDNLRDGFEKTLEQLKRQHIKSIGASTDKSAFERELIVKENGITLGLLNYVTLNTNPKMPENADVFLNYFEFDKVVQHITNLKDKVDHVVVLLHWGGRVEEGFYPDFNQPDMARGFIDAGADLIVGGHSHTVQPYEIYKGKYIFYSLGNFCFDDIVQDDELFEIGRYRKRKTIIPKVSFLKDSYTVKVIHAKNIDKFIKLNNSPLTKFKMHWRNRIFKVIQNNLILWKIYFWHLKKIVPIKMYFIEANDGPLKKIMTLDFKRVLKYIKK